MKRLIILFVLFYCSFHLQAQLNMGFHVGGNLSKFRFSGKGLVFNPDQSRGIGYQMGLSFFKEFENNCNLSGQLLMAMKGIKDLNLTYLNMPILFGGRIKNLNLEIGLEPGVLVSAKSRENGELHNVNEYFRRGDLAVVLGCSYFLTEKVKLNFRTNFGITSCAYLRASYSNGSNKRIHQYNKSTQLSMGFRF